MVGKFVLLAGLAAGSLAAVAGQAAAGRGERALDAAALRQVISGATLELHTPIGTRLPVDFSPDGRMFGRANGLQWYLGSSTDRGRWWIEDGRLCQRWVRWLGGKASCARLGRSTGERLWWQSDDGDSGTATIAKSAPEPVIAAGPTKPINPATRPDPALVPPSAVGAAATRDTRPTAANASNGPITLTVPLPLALAGVDGVRPLSRDHGAIAVPRPIAVAVPVPVSVALPGLPERKDPWLGRHSTATEAVRGDTTATTQLGEQADPLAGEEEAQPMVTVRPAVLHASTLRVRGVAAGDVLNVRFGPSAEHGIAGILAPNTGGIRIVGGCVGEWCPVWHRAAVGWVNSVFLAADQLAARRDHLTPVFADR